MDKVSAAVEAVSNEDKKRIAALVSQVEKRLAELVPANSDLRLEKAMKHCLFAGGKRLRPVLLLVAAEAMGAGQTRALDVACAVEMVHTASLVLDDLPCMDDARQRRGVAVCHAVFGEDIAILAAVTLITRAFQVIATDDALTSDEKVRISSIFSDALGVQGLAGGQESDLRDMQACTDVQRIETMQKYKTSALFLACMRTVGVLSDCKEKVAKALSDFGVHLGLGFQIFDDLLDQLGTTVSTGKDHDQDAGRATFVTAMSVEEAEARALSELQESMQVLDRAGAPVASFIMLVGILFDSYRQARGLADK